MSRGYKSRWIVCYSFNEAKDEHAYFITRFQQNLPIQAAEIDWIMADDKEDALKLSTDIINAHREKTKKERAT